jgi:phosphoenolpyruvate carboxylase
MLTHLRHYIRNLVRSNVTRRFNANGPPAVKDAGVKLRDDIRMLGNMLGEAIKCDDQGVFYSVEKLRALGREWREPGGGSKGKLDEMVKEVKSYDTKKLRGVARAFTHFLALSNSAENHHRVRRLREFLVESKSSAALSSKQDSVLGTMRNLMASQKLKADDIIAALKSQKVELVFTGT